MGNAGLISSTVFEGTRRVLDHTRELWNSMPTARAMAHRFRVQGLGVFGFRV